MLNPTPPNSNLPILPATTPPSSSNDTTHPLTFLDISCYHLTPATVTLNGCQPLFAKLLIHGDHELDVYSGWSVVENSPPCVLTIANADRKARRVKTTLLDLVVFAEQVLRECAGQGMNTGGANTFEGSWQVVVTREPLGRRFGMG
ncbi:MAG: hypothetical protein Q9219_002640 [cf. Caloplaca sp. 3 TL-2023]